MLRYLLLIIFDVLHVLFCILLQIKAFVCKRSIASCLCRTRVCDRCGIKEQMKVKYTIPVLHFSAQCWCRIQAVLLWKAETDGSVLNFLHNRSTLFDSMLYR